MKLECKNCGEERDSIYFRQAIVKGKYYWRRNKCKICIGLDENKIAKSYVKILKSNKLSPEDRSFLKSINNGRIDMLGAYKLADCYLRYFEEVREDMSVEAELIYMWEKLRRLERGI